MDTTDTTENTKEQENMKEQINAVLNKYAKKARREAAIRGFIEDISDWFYKQWYKFNPCYNIKLGFERMFKGYDRRVTWDIGNAMFELLEFAIPKYIKNMHGCPNYYTRKARMILRHMTDEEVDESFKTEYNSSEEEVSVGIALYQSDLQKLLENIKVIKYYDNYWIQNADDEDDKACILREKYPIPMKEDNKELIDHDKLTELREKKMDEVFEYLRKHFDDMWD